MDFSGPTDRRQLQQALRLPFMAVHDLFEAEDLGNCWGALDFCFGSFRALQTVHGKGIWSRMEPCSKSALARRWDQHLKIILFDTLQRGLLELLFPCCKGPTDILNLAMGLLFATLSWRLVQATYQMDRSTQLRG